MFATHRLFGFLLGSTLAGASVYYYILEEYKVSNELLTEDIYVCGPGISLPTPRICSSMAIQHIRCRKAAAVKAPRWSVNLAQGPLLTTTLPGSTSSSATNSFLRDRTGEQAGTEKI